MNNIIIKNMALQDLYKFNSTIVGLNGIYHTIGKDSFFVNSTCIWVRNQIITTGCTYLLISAPFGAKRVKINAIKLIDVYYYDGIVNLEVLDMLKQKRYRIHHNLDKGKQPCSWMLIDLLYLQNKITTNSL